MSNVVCVAEQLNVSEREPDTVIDWQPALRICPVVTTSRSWRSPDCVNSTAGGSGSPHTVAPALASLGVPSPARLWARTMAENVTPSAIDSLPMSNEACSASVVCICVHPFVPVSVTV